MYEHLIFFDDQCPFCHRAVKHILEIDVHKRFLFAPLDGKTSQDILIGPQAHLKGAESLVVVENYQSTGRDFSVRSHAILRVYWLIGNGWGIIGFLSFLPNKLGDFFYRKFAVHRHKFKLKMPEIGDKNRFLP